ncbi:helix-turn-helix transcriptional regulator [Salicibibacter cibarius]|uniref:Helix-turn-helix transcriptional regulator n=1 Tax=Salicibibacter cibarius TaxID=2743000 RepID=A0A7T6Z1Q5_9BACI|nr:helix-turn-helix transcriptional regulator [Salicibibacter cibarius]QQK75057.1 helix-turn-helix transcriptional regulator [Salicibibacter cibarius]
MQPDKRTEIVKKLIGETELSTKAFAEKAGLPYTTLRSMLQRGIGNASVDNVMKVCKALNITTDELQEMAENNTVDLPELTNKDEQDIQKELQKMIDGLSNDGYAAFDGKEMGDMNEEDREMLIQSLEYSMRIAKKMAKQKFTPYKYRK